jgi:hypothetical protein
LDSTDDEKALFVEYHKLHQLLVDKYGRPQEVVAKVYGQCKDQLAKCIEDESAQLKSIWRWKNGIRLTLKMLPDKGKTITQLDYVAIRKAKKSGL